MKRFRSAPTPLDEVFASMNFYSSHSNYSEYSTSTSETEFSSSNSTERRRRKVTFGITQVYEHQIIHNIREGAHLEEDMCYLMTLDWNCRGSYTLPAKKLGNRRTNGRMKSLNFAERREKIINSRRAFPKRSSGSGTGSPYTRFHIPISDHKHPKLPVYPRPALICKTEKSKNQLYTKIAKSWAKTMKKFRVIRLNKQSSWMTKPLKFWGKCCLKIPMFDGATHPRTGLSHSIAYLT